MSSPQRVLVVDDSPTIRRVVKNTLTDDGLYVIAAGSAEQGLQQARATDPDLLIVDLLMRGTSGLTLLKQLAAESSIADVPVLLLTTGEADKGPLEGLGVVGTLEKPFTPSALSEAVRTVLDNHPRRRHHETTPIFALPDEFLSDDLHTSLLPSDEFSLESADQATPSDIERQAADFALRGLSDVLAEALYARGIDGADELSSEITDQVKDSLGQAVLRAFVKHKLGVNLLAQPVPSLYGDLSVVALPEVLQLLKFQGQTGVLDVSLNHGRYEASLFEGRIVSVRARNARAEKRLGRYFIQLGILDEQGLADALLSVDRDVTLGEALVQNGRITRRQLADAVRAQAEDLLFEMLRADQGVFGLRRGLENLAFAPTTPGLSVDAVLLESLRRVDEERVIRRAVPDETTPFHMTEGADLSDLTDDERKALAPFAGGRVLTAQQLATLGQVNIVDAERLMYRLVMLGHLSRAPDGQHQEVP